MLSWTWVLFVSQASLGLLGLRCCTAPPGQRANLVAPAPQKTSAGECGGCASWSCGQVGGPHPCSWMVCRAACDLCCLDVGWCL